jgi:hypothetical protein
MSSCVGRTQLIACTLVVRAPILLTVVKDFGMPGTVQLAEPLRWRFRTSTRMIARIERRETRGQIAYL